MRKVVISGGPSTGKSTTFELLRVNFPDAYFIEEAAERVIRKEQAKQAADTAYTPIMPVTNYTEFAPLVISQQIEDEAKIPPDADLVLMDRCLVDNLGYLAYNGITELAPEVERHAKAAEYTIVFFCDWLNKFERTAIRRETPEEGLAIHQRLEDAYNQSGIPVVHLPAVSADERLTIIQDTLVAL